MVHVESIGKTEFEMPLHDFFARLIEIDVIHLSLTLTSIDFGNFELLCNYGNAYLHKWSTKVKVYCLLWLKFQIIGEWVHSRMHMVIKYKTWKFWKVSFKHWFDI